MRLELVYGLKIIIVSLLSYIPTVTISGWFEAWVAKKNDDDIPEQFGFLTLDPMIHFNIIGFGFLLIGQIFGNYLPIFKNIPGWGHYMPLNPLPSGGWRVVLQFTARALAHFMMLVMSFFMIIALLKLSLVDAVAGAATSQSSLIESIFSVLIFFYHQNTYLCVIYFVVGIFRSVIFFYFPNFNIFSSEHMLWGLLLLVVAVTIGSHVVDFILQTIMGFLTYLLL